VVKKTRAGAVSVVESVTSERIAVAL